MKNLLFLLIFIFCHETFAQKSSLFKGTSVSDFELKFADFDPHSNAVNLMRDADIKVRNFGFEILEKGRIFILNDKGLRASHKTWNFIPKYPKSNITLIKAQTLNLVDGNLTVDKVKSRHQKTTIHSDDKGSFTIHFPNAKVGSILEYEILIRKPYPVFKYPWEISDDLPTLKSKVEFSNNSYNDYEIKIYGNRLLEKYQNATNGKFIYLENINSKSADAGNIEYIEIIIPNLE